MRLTSIFLVICFTVLLAYDFFPEISNILAVPRALVIFLLIAIFILSILFARDKDGHSKRSLKWEIFIIAYILGVMGLFTFLGGESSVGLSFNNEIIWIVAAISVFDIFQRWRKRNKEEAV